MTTRSGSVSNLLRAWGRGDVQAGDNLLPLVYRELRRRAAGYLRDERRDHTLQPTALVHEAYIRLVGQDRMTWQNRAHFFGVAAQMMRRILVDHARAHRAAKRPRTAFKVPMVTGINDQVWLYDVARHAMRPITFAWDNQVFAWTPDSKRIVFSSDRSGASNIYSQSAEGGFAERLTESSRDQGAASCSPEGKACVFLEIGEKTQGDIWLLTLDPERHVRPLIQTPFDEDDPALSPDGHWLAYSSDESGQYQVYLQPFPNLDRKWQVSTDYGERPLWDRHGRELFFRGANGEVMSAAIHSGPAPLDAPRLLFEGRYGDYTVAPDGRFIMVKLGAARPPITQITLVQNWVEELKRRVPAG